MLYEIYMSTTVYANWEDGFSKLPNVLVISQLMNMLYNNWKCFKVYLLQNHNFGVGEEKDCLEMLQTGGFYRIIMFVYTTVTLCVTFSVNCDFACNFL